tara:strand:+ start:3223 stop:5382 length:2160 start_codon:yes stop_codon:yes gene_type:complete
MPLTHQDLLTLHEKAYNNGYDTRLKAADDMLFAWISQWDDTYLAETDLGYRGEFNILRKAMRQITTDLISNQVQVDFEPVDDLDDSGADLMDGMYRNDMRNNSSQEAKKNANQEAIVCGVAAWELRNEYKTNFSGDERQVIKRYPLYEANNNVMWDPNAKLIDKSDAMYVSCLVPYSEDGYSKLVEELTGEEGAKYDSSFSYPEMSYVFPWISQTNKIHVTRFFHREKVKVKYLTFIDMFGTEKTIDEKDFSDYEDEIVDKGFNLVSEKTVERYVVTRYIATGDRILEEVIVPGEHIPVVPQYGERQFVEGEEHYEGIVRLAKDPQRLRNFQMSYLADIVSRSPREKPIFGAEQIQGYEDMYEVNGAENNYPYLKQQMFDANGNPLPVGPVGYIKAPEVPPALMVSMGETRMAVDDVAGAGLPADITDVDLSGKALNSLNKRLDMQSYTYQDNHKYAMRRDGEIYASMAREVYDSEQEITLVKVDGSKSKERINATVMNFEVMEPEVQNDVTKMAFDVYADIGPAFESVKAQNKEELKELLSSGQLDPETHTILLNEYLTMTDGMAFKDLREYSRNKLIVMGVKQPETPEEEQMLQQAQEQQGSQPDAMMVAAMAEQTKAEADMLAQQNKQVELQIQMGKLQVDAEGKQQKLQSETQLNLAKITQEQQKIDNDFADKQYKNALSLTDLELKAQQDLNAAMQNNMLVFDPAVGDFVQGAY